MKARHLLVRVYNMMSVYKNHVYRAANLTRGRLVCIALQPLRFYHKSIPSRSADCNIYFLTEESGASSRASFPSTSFLSASAPAFKSATAVSPTSNISIFHQVLTIHMSLP